MVGPTANFPRTGSRAALLALAALPIAVLLVVRPWGLTLPARLYVPVHTALEVVIVGFGLATFAVQWFAAGAGAFREVRALFLGPAFLAGAILETAHLLAFPGMPGFLGPATTERGIFFWLAARAVTTGALVAAARIEPGAQGVLLGRRRLLFLNLAVAGLAIGLEAALPAHRAWFFVEGRGLTTLKIAAEMAVLAAAAAGALLHARAWRDRGEKVSARLAVALALTALGELCFMLYRHAYDPFNVMGHAYLVMASFFVFDALFAATLVRPYRELDALRAHVEDELVVTIRQLRESKEQREDLLRAVSHDLRNPLQVVLLQCQRLLRAPDGDAARRPASSILAATRRMDRMLRDLADAARSESGNLELAPSAVELKGFVDGFLEVADGVLERPRVQNDIPASVPRVLADPDRLDRILVNLVGNALKYSQDRVVVSADDEGDVVRISVADKGPGIAPEDLPRIFDRYYRGQRHEGEGLGLGLFIVRKLVEAHGGRIWADSRPGQGSTFTFTLPVAHA
ncbi:MAG TPA: MASE3 domain-containing protein [Anaeromyxobacter sp.]